ALEVLEPSGAEIVPTWGFSFRYGGSISAEVFEHCRDAIVQRMQDAMPLDGVFLPLHGAMVAEAPYTDTEGELIRSIRGVVGEIPIVTTYDFHAISSQWEAENAVAFPNNTNPHIDGYDRGREAAQVLLQMIRGEIKPVTHRIFVPIIGPNIGQSTWSHIPEQEDCLLLYQLNRKREQLEKLPGVINITILGGYGYGDSPDTGMSVIATTDNDPALAERSAKELSRELWQRREELLTVRPIASMDDGIRDAMQHPERPVLLVDLGDDPGSACPADSPAVLERLIALGASDCALTIRDAEVVEAGLKAGVGATLNMGVGAKIDQRFYRPVEVEGTIKLIDDGHYAICGPTHGGWGREEEGRAIRFTNVGPRVVLRIGNRIDVIFSRGRTGKDRDFFKSAGIILEEKQILVVKSNQAHRASFDPVAARTVELDTPGVSTVDYRSLPYRYLSRPIWPIDPDMEWEV
ncbi:MAG: M81 family metallopeptidase, partial [Planctomycetota bacterium]|nr:M81 family metallopeptidase [Planctomycetota bacterium]